MANIVPSKGFAHRLLGFPGRSQAVASCYHLFFSPASFGFQYLVVHWPGRHAASDRVDEARMGYAMQALYYRRSARHDVGMDGACSAFAPWLPT